jgi:hypothetical protein
MPPPHFLKIHFNIILPSTPGSPKWSPSLRPPHLNCVLTSLYLNMCYMSRPSHSSRFDYPNDICTRHHIPKQTHLKVSTYHRVAFWQCNCDQHTKPDAYTDFEAVTSQPLNLPSSYYSGRRFRTWINWGSGFDIPCSRLLNINQAPCCWTELLYWY